MITLTLYEKTGPVSVEYRDSNHRYKVDGTFVVGVSSVLNVLAKDLMGWAAWMATEAFKEAIMPYATSERKLTKTELKKLADEAKKAHQVKSQKGKDVGTIVHKWIQEETELGEEVDIPAYSRQLMKDIEHSEDIDVIHNNSEIARHCVKQWRKWKEDYDVEIIKSEFIVHSKKLNYCGTCDVVFRSRRNGKIYVADYKTSEPEKLRNSKYQVVGHRAYPEHFAQIAAYDYANHEEHGSNPDGYAVIYLPKESEYQMFTREAVETDRQGWESLFRVYEWINLIRKAKNA